MANIENTKESKPKDVRKQYKISMMNSLDKNRDINITYKVLANLGS